MQQHNLSWFFSFIIAACFAIPHAAGRYQASLRVIVAFDIAVEENINRPPALQLYYDKGKGFREKHSIRVVLPEKGIPKKIQAYLPATRLHGLRLDYLNGPGRIAIYGLRFVDPFGMELKTHFSPESFILNQTQELLLKNNTLVVQAEPGADDPYIALAFNPALTASKQGKAGSSIVFGLKIFAIMGGAVEILLLIIGKSWINDWFRKRKRKRYHLRY